MGKHTSNMADTILQDNNDEGVPEEHMKYSSLQMDSMTKLPDFMSGPLSRDISVVPGVGGATIEKLAELDIHTLDQLMGKFMSLDRDTALMLQWLEEHKLCGRFAETCVHALAMRLHSLLD